MLVTVRTTIATISAMVSVAITIASIAILRVVEFDVNIIASVLNYCGC